jgi:methylthioribulose-1-phosphate dehydratase
MSRSPRVREGTNIGGPLGFRAAAAALAEVGREFHRRGWALGTSGNFSCTLTRHPAQIAITHTGVDKGRLTNRQIVKVDAAGKTLQGTARPSDETRLHLMLVNRFGAGAVLHTHSVWGTMASDTHAAAGGVCIEGYEMLKGLEGVRTHEHREWLPVIENSQDMTRLAGAVQSVLEASSNPHGFLLRRHGLYTWGRTLDEAKRHAEILEFLLEILGRRDGTRLQPRNLRRNERRP